MREGALIMEVASRKFIYCNRSFTKMFGIEKSDEIDITLLRKLRKSTLSPDEIMKREILIKEKGSFSELVEYTTLDGHSFFVEASTRLYESDDKDYYLYVINPIDRSFFEVESIGILMINRQGDIVTANPFVLKQFGYNKADLIGKKIELLIPLRYHNRHVKDRHEFIHTPEDRPMGKGMDLFGIKKDGTEFPVEVSLGHYPSDGDKYIIAFINDISFRKMAEINLKTANEKLEGTVEKRTKVLKETLGQLELSKTELQKNANYQKALFDNAGVMITTVDLNGVIQTFNPAAQKALGYTAEEVIGKHTPLIFHNHALLRQRAKKLSQEYKREIAVGSELFLIKARMGKADENEWEYVRKDGTKFPVRLIVSAIKDDHAAIIGFAGVAIDISETQRIEKELQQSLEKEKELNELKTRFVTMASHEFRTPLSTVLSSAYLIEKYTTENEQPKREKHLQRIVSSVNLLTDTLNDFLSLGKIEEGKIHLKYSEFNIKELVQSLISEIKNILKKGQKIFYEHEGNEKLFLDRSLLTHIIINLLSNASKFSSEESAIRISTICEDGRLTLSVKDKGIGISSDDKKHLMERFFRATNATNIQGTGLGLHLISKYTELMNGVIECITELERGTEFIITFNKTN